MGKVKIIYEQYYKGKDVSTENFYSCVWVRLEHVKQKDRPDYYILCSWDGFLRHHTRETLPKESDKNKAIKKAVNLYDNLLTTYKDFESRYVYAKNVLYGDSAEESPDKRKFELGFHLVQGDCVFVNNYGSRILFTTDDILQLMKTRFNLDNETLSPLYHMLQYKRGQLEHYLKKEGKSSYEHS